MPEGPKITQLAAFSDPTRGWITLELPEPAEGKLWGPILGPNMAVYVHGRRVYAFSGPASKWGVLEFPEGAEPDAESRPRSPPSCTRTSSTSSTPGSADGTTPGTKPK